MFVTQEPKRKVAQRRRILAIGNFYIITLIYTYTQTDVSTCKCVSLVLSVLGSALFSYKSSIGNASQSVAVRLPHSDAKSPSC